jgi:hypothetical protein
LGRRGGFPGFLRDFKTGKPCWNGLQQRKFSGNGLTTGTAYALICPVVVNHFRQIENVKRGHAAPACLSIWMGCAGCLGNVEDHF